jgi:hypothetical protein
MAVRVHTAAGVELLFLGSHAIQESSDPVFSFEFTEAVVEYAGGPAPIVARGKRGPHKEYASPAGVSHALKIAACLDALAGGPDVPCGLEAARSHTICVNGIHESASEPAGFPPELLHQTGCGPQRLVHVDGLPDVLRRCYHRSALLSELGVPWARPGREVDVRNYRWFPGGTSTVSSQ